MVDNVVISVPILAKECNHAVDWMQQSIEGLNKTFKELADAIEPLDPYWTQTVFPWATREVVPERNPGRAWGVKWPSVDADTLEGVWGAWMRNALAIDGIAIPKVMK